MIDGADAFAPSAPGAATVARKLDAPLGGGTNEDAVAAVAVVVVR